MLKNSEGGYVIKEAQIKHLEGVLLTHIEAMVPGPQQVAAKSLVSQAVWDLLEPSYIWIDGDVLKEVVTQNPKRSFVPRKS